MTRSHQDASTFGAISVGEPSEKNFIFFSEIYRTWSCDTCYMIEADLVPPSSFDSSDYFELGLSTPIKEAIQWSFPVKSVNYTKINNENIVKIDFTNGDLASIEKTGFWKVKFQIEIKEEFKNLVSFLAYQSVNMNKFRT